MFSINRSQFGISGTPAFRDSAISAFYRFLRIIEEILYFGAFYSCFIHSFVSFMLQLMHATHGVVLSLIDGLLFSVSVFTIYIFRPNEFQLHLDILFIT